MFLLHAKGIITMIHSCTQMCTQLSQLHDMPVFVKWQVLLYIVYIMQLHMKS